MKTIPFTLHNAVTLGLLGLLTACQSTGVNPTGLTGGQVMCPSGSRPSLDCRGVLQQYARDFKFDLDAMSKVKAGIATSSTKLTEADALTSDLLQHYYQACTLYNACMVAPQEYVEKTAKLQEIQLNVRRSLVGVGTQQNIQINPQSGSPFSPSISSAEGITPSSPTTVLADQSQPGASTPGFSIKVAQGPQDSADTVLNVLREGSKLLREQPAPVQQPAQPLPAIARAQPVVVAPAPVAPRGDLDSGLKSLLMTLKENVERRGTTRGGGQTVVGNLAEEGQPWSSPVGAVLRDRLASLVQTEGIFKPVAQTRGISVTQVAAVPNPNDPRALGAMYGADLSISGSYRVQQDQVSVQLTAIDNQGNQLAQATGQIPAQSIPNVLSATPVNATQTKEVLGGLNQLGPQAQGEERVEVTTNKPGAGASFRLGEEIKYFVKSTVSGYLYLFHIDADKKMVRIFPNQYQREARINAGVPVEVPGSGVPFKFEASPPFGLETTVALVTTVPLDEKDFQMLEGGFTAPTQSLPTLVATRGIAIKAPGAATPSTPTSPSAPRLVWNTVTVLIRP